MTNDVGVGPRTALDVLARLEAVEVGGDIETLVRPLLDLVASLTGLEAVYLTRIDWDAGLQSLDVVRNDDPADFPIVEGLVVDWEDTLCRRAQQDGWGWTVGVEERWPDAGVAQDLGLRSYVSVPVVVDDDESPYGTLCGASPRLVEDDERVVATLRLLARMVGDALAKDAELARTRERAQVAEQRLEERIEFAAKVEHALRTPIAVIGGWAATLGDERFRGTPTWSKGLEVLTRTSERLQTQVADLLFESRMAMRTVQLEQVDVAAIVADAHSPDWDSHDISVEGALTTVTDPVMLAVVLEHLVDNAVWHTPLGTAVRVVLAPTSEGGTITVEDDGPGLPDRDDLFEPFVTADPAPRRPGTGLGLHIVLELVTQLGGSLTVGTSASGGARFVIDLVEPED